MLRRAARRSPRAGRTLALRLPSCLCRAFALTARAALQALQGAFSQEACGVHTARTVPCRRCSGVGCVRVRHVAPLLLLPKRPMISSQFDAAAALKHFSGVLNQGAPRFRVHNVTVALDP